MKKIKMIDVLANYWHSKHSSLDEFDPYFNESRKWFHYELTISFNQRTHTRASAYAELSLIVQRVLSWYEVDILNVATEYQKNGFPHYHCHLICPSQIDSGIRADGSKAFGRYCGLTDFKPVANLQKWEDYYIKDIVENYKKYKFEHLEQYVSKDM